MDEERMKRTGMSGDGAGDGGETAATAAALLSRARSGDADAFTALAAPCERAVYSLCLHMMGSREDAEDAAQDALLSAFRGIGGFTGGSSFATWLYHIARNACLDALRRRARRPAASLDELADDGAALPAASQPTPEEAYLRASRTDALRAAAKRLPAEMRALLFLRFTEGLSYEDIARAMDIPSGTVKSRLNRARARLGELFAQLHGTDDAPPPDAPPRAKRAVTVGSMAGGHAPPPARSSGDHSPKEILRGTEQTRFRGVYPDEGTERRADV